MLADKVEQKLKRIFENNVKTGAGDALLTKIEKVYPNDDFITDPKEILQDSTGIKKIKVEFDVYMIKSKHVKLEIFLERINDANDVMGDVIEITVQSKPCWSPGCIAG